MATIDLKLKSYDELQFEIMRLNIDNYLKQQQIEQLTNNWNELEEWLKSNEEHFAEAIPFRETLRKMKEIKNTNN